LLVRSSCRSACTSLPPSRPSKRCQALIGQNPDLVRKVLFELRDLVAFDRLGALVLFLAFAREDLSTATARTQALQLAVQDREQRGDRPPAQAAAGHRQRVRSAQRRVGIGDRGHLVRDRLLGAERAGGDRVARAGERDRARDRRAASRIQVLHPHAARRRAILRGNRHHAGPPAGDREDVHPQGAARAAAGPGRRGETSGRVGPVLSFQSHESSPSSPDEIDQLLDGEQGFGVAPLQAHLRDCAECRAALDEARVVVEALEHLPRFAPSTDFAQRVDGTGAGVRALACAARDAMAGWLRPLAPRSQPVRVALAGAGLSLAAMLSVASIWLLAHLDCRCLLRWGRARQPRPCHRRGGSTLVEALVGRSGAQTLGHNAGAIVLASVGLYLLMCVAAAALLRAAAVSRRRRA